MDKKKKIDLGSFNDLATSLPTACAKMEAREAFLMERLSERAEVREAVVEEVEKAMKKMERFFKEKRDEDQRPTFAEVAKPKVAFPHLRVQNRLRENVVVVYPLGGLKEGPRDASVETKKRLVELIKPREDNLQVRNMRPVGKGGVLVEAASSSEAGKFFESQALKNSGFVVSRPKVVLPKVMIYDVPNDISEDEVRHCLESQNPTLRPPTQTIQAGLKLVKRMPVRDRKVEHWVLEC